MKNLFKIPKKQMHYYVLALVMILFIVFPIEVPHELASLVDSVLGKMVIVIVVLNLFIAHPVVGAIGAVAAYELVKRSHGISKVGGLMREFIPSEHKKTSNLNALNQFPITVEEIVIKSKIPYSFNLSDNDITNPSYKPILGDLHEASRV
jgi:hypothetical protein